jgi:hypothetical protein
VNVIHLCEVDQPIIETAELLKTGPDGPIFRWSSSAFKPGRVVDTTTSVRSNALAVDFWTNIWNTKGVAVGDDITMNVTRHYKVKDCRVNVSELLRNPDVRADLTLSRSDSPEAEAARQRLPGTVAKAVDGMDLGSLISYAEIARKASDAAQRPMIRQSGTRIVVLHGTGVAAGRNPDVSAETRTRIGKGFRVK